MINRCSSAFLSVQRRIIDLMKCSADSRASHRVQLTCWWWLLVPINLRCACTETFYGPTEVLTSVLYLLLLLPPFILFRTIMGLTHPPDRPYTASLDGISPSTTRWPCTTNCTLGRDTDTDAHSINEVQWQHGGDKNTAFEAHLILYGLFANVTEAKLSYYVVIVLMTGHPLHLASTLLL